MRKKPDNLLLLTVFVVTGLVISNFVVFEHSNKMNNLSLSQKMFNKIINESRFNLPSDVSQQDNSQQDKELTFQSTQLQQLEFKSHEIVHIDSLKQQTR